MTLDFDTFFIFAFRIVHCVTIAMQEIRPALLENTFAINASKFSLHSNKPQNKFHSLNKFCVFLVALSMANRFVSVVKSITDTISIVHHAIRNWIQQLVK